MIKSIIRKLFAIEEHDHKPKNKVQVNNKLEKGKVKSICTPDLGNQAGLFLKKWFVKPGDHVKTGDIVCEIENENIVMEFESFYCGKIISTCSQNEELEIGQEIFKIEGV